MNERLEGIVKKDCFAMKENLKKKCLECKALKELYCKDGNCHFYMTQEEFKEKNRKSREHLKEIDWTPSNALPYWKNGEVCLEPEKDEEESDGK